MSDEPTRLLVTGVGPAAFAMIAGLDRSRYSVHVASSEPVGALRSLLPEDRRHRLPRPDCDDYVEALLHLCRRAAIEVVVPTTDAEQLLLATGVARFRELGVDVLVASAPALRRVLDRYALLIRVRELVPVAESQLLDPGFLPAPGFGPAMVKPRSGPCSSFRVVTTEGLDSLPRDGSLLVQEELPGPEFEVDVLSNREGLPLIAVPRVKTVDRSGSGVLGSTLRHPVLEGRSRELVGHLELPFANCVRWKEDASGVPKLLEIRPGLQASAPLVVKSGIDLPRLCLELLGGRDGANPCTAFRPITMQMPSTRSRADSRPSGDLDRPVRSQACPRRPR